MMLVKPARASSPLALAYLLAANLSLLCHSITSHTDTGDTSGRVSDCCSRGVPVTKHAQLPR